MARRIFPDPGYQLVYSRASELGVEGEPLLSAAFRVLTLYADEAGTVLADLLSYPGQFPIADSQLTLTGGSTLPLFYGPDGLSVLWDQYGNPVAARSEDRIDAVETSQAELVGLVESIELLPGPTGPTGPAGPSGTAGAAGASGVGGGPGPTGPTGASGVQGIVGPTGPSGVPGARGATGPAGVTGLVGPAGVTGPSGINGVWRGDYDVTTVYNANDTVEYQGSTFIAKNSGLLSTPPAVATDVVTVSGPAGPAGATGPSGVAGPAGATGPAGTGATGPTGPVGATGPSGVSGAGLGGELGYVELATGTDLTEAAGTQTTIFGVLSVTTTGKVAITFSGNVYNNTANKGVLVTLYEDGVAIDSAVAGMPGSGTGAGNAVRLTFTRRRSPTPGVHTYEAKFIRYNSGTGSVSAAVSAPSSLSVVAR